jgi:hypothetical protein
VRRGRRRTRLRLTREVWLLRRRMSEAQREGDVDGEYRLLCLIECKTSEIDALR